MSAHTDQVQYFTGPNMRAVLAQVRDTFGRDALILSQEQRHGRVRIAAAGSSTSSSTRRPATLAEQVVSGSGPATAELLTPLGYTPSIISQLPSAAPEQADIARRIAQTLNGAQQLPHRGIFRLIGPPGSGKTSAIVNWAAEHLRLHGAQTLQLVSTDTDRLAGTAMLDRAGEILGVQVAHSTQDLAAPGPDQLVLIDTRSGTVPQHVDAATNVLVVSALDESSLESSQESAIILTHSDRADTFGGTFSRLAETQKRLLAFGVSGDVPGGIGPANAAQIERFALRGLRTGVEEF